MILGHALSRASAVILLVLAVALNAGLTTCENVPGCADYIRAGLGYEGPVQITQTEYEYCTTTEQVVVTGTGNAPASTLDLVEASACSSSWSRYSSRQSKNVVVKLITSTIYTALSTKLTYGTGDVYTTDSIYNIPIANGNFTATSTGKRFLNITSTIETNVDVTLNSTLAKATPTCSLIKPKECSRLYDSYISSLGLPFNASVPDITPVPANSPPCPTWFYKPFSTCTKSFVTSYPNDCTILGNSVQLFYFPTQTITADADPTSSDALATITTPPAVIYEYAPGTTFTSPSIYLKFDYLSAERLSQGNDAAVCSVCDKLGCRQQAVDGGQEWSIEGTSIEGQIVSLAPEEVSSIVLNFNDQEASSIISTMAHGLPGYADVMNKVVGNFDVVAKRLSLDDVQHPPPEAYYLQPLDNAPGCGLSAPQPQCSTIFEGAYRALISLPQEVTGFQGEWKSCFPVIYGVYDPPIALTRASTADGATLPGYRPTANNPQNTQTPQTAQPADLPQIPPIARPTALPNELPGENGSGNRPAGPTLPNSGGSSNTGGSNSGGTNSNGGGSGNNGGASGYNGGGSGNNGAGSSNTGGTSNNNGADSSGNGGGSDNNQGGTNNNGGESNGSGGGNGGGSDNNQGGTNNNGGESNGSGGRSGNNGASSNNGGGSSNNNEAASGNDVGGGSGTSGSNGSSDGGSGGGSGTTNGDESNPGEDNNGADDGSNDGESDASSRASTRRTTTRQPSGTGTPTTNSDDSGSTSDSSSNPSLASAALPRAVIPLLALCLSLSLSTTRFLVP
ncbi:hypothetical protein Slin14017_G082590 [Septoria linicola]|nr:hypothetical protein Slin14017_G082590 [Septoria linicola]